LLGLTNYWRFGSPFEFGHRLTISSSSMMYLTRFGNPYRKTPFLQAIKELFGILFITDPRGRNAFSDHLFAGQAPFTRWRKLELTTFDLGYLAVLLIGIVGTTISLLRRRKHAFQKYEHFISFSLLSWTSLSAAGLAYF